MTLQPQGSSSSQSTGLAIDLHYILLAGVYVALLYWLGSHGVMGPATNDRRVGLVDSLYHIPLYAGLGFFILLAISRGQALAAHRWTRAALTLVVAGVIATFNEWRQALILGRDPSAVHLLFDLTGVVVLLFICALGAAQEPQR